MQSTRVEKGKQLTLVMDKGRRNELRDLKWKKRLKHFNGKRKNPKDWIRFRDQGSPCSCPMCSGDKYNRAKMKRDINGGTL